MIFHPKRINTQEVDHKKVTNSANPMAAWRVGICLRRSGTSLDCAIGLVVMLRSQSGVPVALMSITLSCSDSRPLNTFFSNW